MTERHVSEKLADLLERAGLDRKQLAGLLGKKHSSGFARYFNKKQMTSGYIPDHFLHRITPFLIGRGDPPITEEDIFGLGLLALPPKTALSSRLPDAARPLQETADKVDAYGVTVGGVEGYIEMGKPIESVFSPPSLARVPGAYALYIDGNLMEPRYYAGELVYAHPTKPPVRYRYVVVQVANGDDAPPHAYVRQFIGWTKDELVVRHLNPMTNERIPREKVVAVHRVADWGEQ